MRYQFQRNQAPGVKPMTKGEQETIANVIRRLKGGRDGNTPSSSDEITAMLNNHQMRIWLDTWVIGALECLQPGESRDVDLAVRLSR
jgi:hypothetical protein